MVCCKYCTKVQNKCLKYCVLLVSFFHKKYIILCYNIIAEGEDPKADFHGSLMFTPTLNY